MLLGFALPVSGSWASPANCRHVARRAEGLGYASLWTFQRLLSPLNGDEPTLAPPYRSVHDPLAVLAYAAGQTSTVRLGVAVANMPYHAPLVLAKTLTTLATSATVGSMSVSASAGCHRRWRLRAPAWSGGEPGPRTTALPTGHLDRLGRRLHGRPLPGATQPFGSQAPAAPAPSLLLGGGADVALRRAGRVASGWISSSRADLRRIDESIATIRAAAVDTGRDPEELRFVCRGVVKVRAGERAPLVSGLELTLVLIALGWILLGRAITALPRPYPPGRLAK